MKALGFSVALATTTVLLLGGANAATLDGAAAKKVMAGATITGTNAAGNPYTVTFSRSGSVKGKAGFNDEYKDTGSWWMDGDQFCRQYKVWFDNKVGCYGISTKGNVVRFHSKSGTIVDQSKLK